MLQPPARRLLVALVAVVAFAALALPPPAAAIDCPTRSLPRPTEDYAVTKARLEAAGQWHKSNDPLLSPPPDPQVGDTWLWYVWDLSGFPVANLKPATVRGMGDHCYVVVDDDEWNVGMDQTDVDRIVSHFDHESPGMFPDQGIWDLDTGNFGQPPNNLDGLDRIFLFYYRFNISSDGFFWAYDQYPDGSQPFASNECDVIYMAVDNGQPAADYMLAVTAHEFQHMIQFNTDGNEVSWVDEGLSELAMWLFGHPDTISAFNTQPDNSLLSFGGAWADYIKVYLWSLYAYEQFGGQPFVWDVAHNPLNSMAGYQSSITNQGYPDLTEDVVGNWAAANYADDPTIPNGQYGYEGDDLPPFSAFRTHTSYPVASSGSVQPTAADYIRLQNFSGPVTVRFDGLEPRQFRVTLIATDPAQPTLVLPIPLDGVQAGEATFTAAAGYQQITIAVANVSQSGTGAYQYWAEEVSTDVPATAMVTPTLDSYPNPFNPRTTFAFSLPHAADVGLSVLDVRGHEVARLTQGQLGAGDHVIPWQGDDIAAGIYLGRLMVDGKVVSTRKVTVVK